MKAESGEMRWPEADAWRQELHRDFKAPRQMAQADHD